jgi:hypothetical protein
MVTRGIRAMVIGPGGCRFGDNWRPEPPLLVLFALVAALLVSVFRRCGIRPAVE